MPYLDRIFGGGRKTYVSTSVSRVIDDKFIPSSVKSGLSTALVAGGGIPENVMEKLVHSIGVRADRMHNYASESYVYHLPYGRGHSPVSTRTLTLPIISTIVGTAITAPIYFDIGAPNFLHMAWVSLVADHGLNSLNNTLGGLTTSLGTTVWLENMQVFIGTGDLNKLPQSSMYVRGYAASSGPTPYRVGLLGLRNTPSPQLDTGSVTSYVRVSYVYTQTVPVVVDGVTVNQAQRVDGSFNISMVGYDNAAGYFQTSYIDTNGIRRYWTYKVGAGTYPTLDSAYDTAQNPLGEFFPFVYLRFFKQPASTNTASQEYITSRKLVKYLGIDYGNMVTTINSNPQIADVEQAIMMFAVPANSTNPVEQRYLFDLFYRIYLDAHSADPTKVAHEAAFSITDYRYSMALDIPEIRYIRKAGVIGTVGTVTAAITDWEVPADRLDSSNGWAGVITSNIILSKTYTYRKQISQSYYDEVIVSGLSMTYEVLNGYTTTAGGYSPNLVIPVDRAITRNYSITEREILYSRSLHYLFNASQSVYIEWYQTPTFGFLLLAAAIVIAVVDGGTTFSALTAAGLGTLSAAAFTLAIIILQGIIVRFVLRLFVNAVGKDFALLVAIALAIKGSYDAIKAGSVAGAPMAREMLTLSSGISNSVGEFIHDELNALSKDRDAYNDLLESRSSQLESANALLERSSTLSPFVIFGEKPDDFYNRTIHTGNIGVTSIELTKSYVDIALTLPKLS